jgi:hypothetical protein
MVVSTTAAPPPPPADAAAAGPPPVIGELSGGTELLGSGAERAGRVDPAPCARRTGDGRAGAAAGSGARAVWPSHDAGETGQSPRYPEVARTAGVAGAAGRESPARSCPAPDVGWR